MNLALRNIKEMTKMSEETPCYTATLWLDGRYVADVSNHGHGGPDMVRWTMRDSEVEKTIADYFASLPPLPSQDGIELQPDLELWCHEQVNDAGILRSLKGTLKRKVVGITLDGRELHFKVAPAALTDEVRARIAAAHPGIIVLNGMSDAVMLAAVKGAAA